MLIHLKPLCELTGLNEGVVYSWVKKEVIIPVRKGRGRYTVHAFSPQQVYALAYIETRRKWGQTWRLDDVKVVIQQFESSWSDEAIEQLIIDAGIAANTPTATTEEAWAKQQADMKTDPEAQEEFAIQFAYYKVSLYLHQQQAKDNRLSALMNPANRMPMNLNKR